MVPLPRITVWSATPSVAVVEPIVRAPVAALASMVWTARALSFEGKFRLSGAEPLMLIRVRLVWFVPMANRM